MENQETAQCRVVSYGPDQAALDEHRQRTLAHPAIQECLGQARHRLLAYQLVGDDAKGSEDPPPPSRYRATFYDYTNNMTVMAEGALDDADDIEVTEHGTQPLPSAEEFAAAVELVAADPRLGPAIADGSLHPYRPMPPLLEAEEADGGQVERTVNVGLLPGEGSLLAHEIVGVNMVTEGVVRFEGQAPAGSVALTTSCGPPSAGQPTASRGTAGQYLVTVTQGGVELWRFLAVRPAASSGTNGSGVELIGVFYRGTKVLDRAHVPILNVRYDNDVCGPYRDWQWQESQIPVSGTDVAPGFRRSETPVQTILESGQDGGNFLGVALYTQGQETVLVSEMEAGWYRYISEWRLHNDGTIRPRFGFSAVRNSCVCVTHHHHVYWRFDFDIRTAGNNRVREFNNPLLPGISGWRTLIFETRRVRNAARQRRWSVEHTSTGEGYVLTPGPDDGVADSFGVGDVWALQYRGTPEFDDGQGFTTNPTLAMAQLDRFVNLGARIDNNDVVLWYAAHFTHDVSGSHAGDSGHRVGPDLRPINWPGLAS